ncbi:MAG: adenosine kinase [Prolixibacteraceae bacterium]|nr:adenosine kinase [Prolixibacteraceae bacterium]
MVGNTKELPAVLGIGNALVDVMIQLKNDETLASFGLPRGSMTLVDDQLSQNIFKTVSGLKTEIATGGSAANTIHALSSLGGNCGYLGKINDDELGNSFKNEFKSKSIKTHLYFSDKATGRVMVLVSTDSERTMATYLGAAADLKPSDIKSQDFEGYSILYIEGYLVQDHELIEKAIKTAKSKGLKIAVDLSSFNVVEQNLGFLKRIVSGYVDIVFANEEEAFSFTGEKPETALNIIAADCEIAIVKTGRSGSLIKCGDDVFTINPVKANAVDTTGAGDSYAAGFLYGYTKGFNLEKCGEIASLVSAKMVEVIGAKLPDSTWSEIIEEIENI